MPMRRYKGDCRGVDGGVVVGGVNEFGLEKKMIDETPSLTLRVMFGTALDALVRFHAKCTKRNECLWEPVLILALRSQNRLTSEVNVTPI
jgi:hypothetical protein